MPMPRVFLAVLAILGACDDSVTSGQVDLDLASDERALASGVVLNEHTAGTSGWIELYNPTAGAIDVSGWSVDDIAGGGTAPKALPVGSSVAAGGFLVVTYSGINTSSSDVARLVDAAGVEVDSHTSGWTSSTIAGLCFGRTPDGGAWAAAAVPCTKGASNGAGTTPPPVSSTVIVNEHSGGSSGWVELYNTGASVAAIGGWQIDDVANGGSAPTRLPTTTTIPAHGWLVVPYAGINTASADMVRLVDANANEVDAHANGYAGSSIAGRCFGRVFDGGAWATASQTCSKGASNGAPAPSLSPVINEFAPGAFGWVELYNPWPDAISVGSLIVDDGVDGNAGVATVPTGEMLASHAYRVVALTSINASSIDGVRLIQAVQVLDQVSNFFTSGTLNGKCFGRLPDGGAWRGSSIVCTSGASNGTAPVGCGAGACNDGDRCTTGEHFVDGCTCGGGTAIACDDQNPCTVDACGAASGCVSKPVANGTPCGTGLTCTAGQCKP